MFLDSGREEKKILVDYSTTLCGDNGIRNQAAPTTIYIVLVVHISEPCKINLIKYRRILILTFTGFMYFNN
jgi:hypothetical protein